MEAGTWVSNFTINSVENSDFTQYRCMANNREEILKEHPFNLVLSMNCSFKFVSSKGGKVRDRVA
jgi:ribosomal protein S27E